MQKYKNHKYEITKSEMETLISYNAIDNHATIYTSIPKDIIKYDERCNNYPEHFREIKHDQHSKTYECDKKYATISKPRLCSDKQKKQKAETLLMNRNKVIS